MTPTGRNAAMIIRLTDKLQNELSLVSVARFDRHRYSRDLLRTRVCLLVHIHTGPSYPSHNYSSDYLEKTTTSCGVRTFGIVQEPYRENRVYTTLSTKAMIPLIRFLRLHLRLLCHLKSPADHRTFTPASGEKRSPCSERHLLRKTTSLHTP